MKSKPTMSILRLATVTLLMFALALPSFAFRMIQQTAVGRTTAGAAVQCNDPGGFAHWNTREITWNRNPQGFGHSAVNALYWARVEWGTDSSFTLRDGGNTAAGWATDGINTTIWRDVPGCGDGCYGLTALVLGPGQEIVESDIAFRVTNVRWRTDGRNRRRDVDVQAVATHEFGHSLGIHHSEVPGATMRRIYTFDYRSLEADDRAAATCIDDTYPANTPPPCTAAPATPQYISGPNYYHCQGSTNQYSTNTVPNTVNYRWEVLGAGFNQTTTGPSIGLNANFPPGYYNIRVRAENTCGSSGWYTNLLVIVDPNSGGYCQ